MCITYALKSSKFIFNLIEKYTVLYFTDPLFPITIIYSY